MTKLKQVFWEGTEDWGKLLDSRAAITGGLALTKFVQDAVAAANKR